MKRPRIRAVDLAQYLGVRALVGVAQAMTIEQSYALADGLAAVLYRVDRRHREVAMENLRLAFGEEYDERGRDKIVRGVYRHFCRMVIEMLHIPRKLNITNWRRYVELIEPGPMVGHLLDGGPIVMLSGHFGNWELAGYVLGMFGFPSSSVARTLDNPYLDRFLRTFRERTGQKLIAKKGGYDEMLGVLGDGRILSFLADQDAGERGLFVDFFGRPASTHKAIALLALDYRAPIVVGYARRVGPGFRYEVGCADVIDPAELSGGADDVRIVTQRFTTALERVIRRDPDQYLWLHRRWKHRPKVREKGARRDRPAGADGAPAGPIGIAAKDQAVAAFEARRERA